MLLELCSVLQPSFCSHILEIIQSIIKEGSSNHAAAAPVIFILKLFILVGNRLKDIKVCVWFFRKIQILETENCSQIASSRYTHQDHFVPKQHHHVTRIKITLFNHIFYLKYYYCHELLTNKGNVLIMLFIQKMHQNRFYYLYEGRGDYPNNIKLNKFYLFKVVFSSLSI